MYFARHAPVQTVHPILRVHLCVGYTCVSNNSIGEGEKERIL